MGRPRKYTTSSEKKAAQKLADARYYAKKRITILCNKQKRYQCKLEAQSSNNKVQSGSGRRSIVQQTSQSSRKPLRHLSLLERELEEMRVHQRTLDDFLCGPLANYIDDLVLAALADTPRGFSLLQRASDRIRVLHSEVRKCTERIRRIEGGVEGWRTAQELQSPFDDAVTMFEWVLNFCDDDDDSLHRLSVAHRRGKLPYQQ
ncbi:hypothetical protein CYLTODRAFT_495428 [Cylindrobasidium torrendii FP15055 ss-10]|uniref:Uncharacterized protein n=1 Tax=Cylindrobasidium torrendii FP15055 ss-10 TaxID=1314674 RepID=A0A0D7AT71_9AGAR|nr:hypothetical protein CYLTODRAFT_495428 [Cylindrobasidium torrendii FP15055 ss-10]